jgi:hypothetical protein
MCDNVRYLLFGCWQNHAMRYPMPNYPCDFEIPDDWLAAAGMYSFARSASAYRSTAAAALVPLQTIVPPPRFPTASKDWHGFDRIRLVSILKGIAIGAEIERDGFHRFYASIAAGFSSLPAVIS